MRDIPNGTSQEKIEKWAKAHNLDWSYYEKEHFFHVHIERIPVKNIPDAFVCSHWDIFLKIDIDTKGHSSNTDITSSGTCL